MARSALVAGIACLLGWSVVCAVPPASRRVRAPAPAPASAADTWLSLISDMTPSVAGGESRAAAADPADDEGAADWFPRPVPVSLPVGRGRDGKPVSVPVLLLPIPIGGGGGGSSLKTTSRHQCDIPALTPQSSYERPALTPQSSYETPALTPQSSYERSALTPQSSYERPALTPQSSYETPALTPQSSYERPALTPQSSYEKHALTPQSSYERPALTPQSSYENSFKGYSGQQPQPPASPAPPSTQHSRLGDEPVVPRLDYVVSSRQLVELFRAQEAPSPELPPAVIPDGRCAQSWHEGGWPAPHHSGERFVRGAPPPPRGRGRPARTRRYEVGATPPPPPPLSALHGPPAGPAPLRLDRSLVLRGALTVPRAGYTEPYTVWWDAVSGAARVDLHCGATSIYRTVMPDGRMREVELRVDRTGDAGEVRRCAVTSPRAPAAADRALPALPDLQPFLFTGYVESEYGRVERWAHSVGGGPGELGGARGETLTFRHELLAVRGSDNVTATPLKYSVSVDSSVLGAASDGHVHRYTELRDQRHEPGLFVLDLVEACDEVRRTTARDVVDPLREFTLSHREPRYDAVFSEFKRGHARRYGDDAEEAVRKNLVVQHARFVASNNRQGATFATEMNHLSDRLDAELAVLGGVPGVEAGGPGGGAVFPLSRDQLDAARSALPRRFDWRKKGAVTHVRNQDSCSSCWAFAVTGAVEGALFAATGALVPLSEQSLVDCAGPFGGHGCGGTWPRAAYDYVRDRGLPALSRYTPYQGKVLQCARESEAPVTRISGHVNVTKYDADALKVAIKRFAPAVVIIDDSTKTFIFYKKGVLNDMRCAKNKPRHAVLAVGWGGAAGGDHFIVKNSWSTAWGDAGYARLAARPNTCGVLTWPSYPRLERADVSDLAAPADAAPPPS